MPKLADLIEAGVIDKGAEFISPVTTPVSLEEITPELMDTQLTQLTAYRKKVSLSVADNSNNRGNTVLYANDNKQGMAIIYDKFTEAEYTGQVLERVVMPKAIIVKDASKQVFYDVTHPSSKLKIHNQNGELYGIDTDNAKVIRLNHLVDGVFKIENDQITGQGDEARWMRTHLPEGVQTKYNSYFKPGNTNLLTNEPNPSNNALSYLQANYINAFALVKDASIDIGEVWTGGVQGNPRIVTP